MNEHRLEYNGRDFQKDLDDISTVVLEMRMKGQQSVTMGGSYVPFFPTTGWLHKWVDRSDGFPNYDHWERHVYARNLWVVALQNALRERFPEPPPRFPAPTP